tara:strand:+ start:67 stop:222 length:156 start_codon:yes stop_codon:yes gene_type:complete
VDLILTVNQLAKNFLKHSHIKVKKNINPEKEEEKKIKLKEKPPKNNLLEII